jgi:UDP-N-acetylmuramyl tripeptide synthase
VLLGLEIALARAVGRLSRLSGRGGGTTLPGKLLNAIDPGAVPALARRLPRGCVLVSATNGKTTTTALAAGILSPNTRLVYNSSGANLASGIASALLARDGAELGLFEVDEAALPQVTRLLEPRAVCLGNLFRDQLDRYGELELVAERWRDVVGTLPTGTRVVVNADDPILADLVRERRESLRFGLDDPRHARPALQHAADSKHCLRCGRPYTYAAAYIGHLGDYSCPACGQRRPPLDVVGRRIELAGVDHVSFELVAPTGTRRIRLPLPGLYNVYNALAAASVALALGSSIDEIATGLEGAAPAFGRFERIVVGDRSVLLLLIKNPAGANEAVRTLLAGPAPKCAVVALNDRTADGRDVSWIWDVDFEPLTTGLEHVIVSGQRAAELALRFEHGGLSGSAIDVVPDLASALEAGLTTTPAGGELVVLPTYTAMLELRGVLAERGHVDHYWRPSA